MNKSEFVKTMAVEIECTQAETARFIDTFLTLVPDVLLEDGKLQFPGFGTFTCTERAARKGRNPATGKSIDIAATNVIKFKVGAGLKKAVNE